MTMTARSPSAFMLSAGLHAAVVAVLLLLGYTASRNSDEAPRIFQLVQGEGDNYGATEAPALGVPGGVKLDVPQQPTPPTSAREEAKEVKSPPPTTFTPPPAAPAAPVTPKAAPTTPKTTPERVLPNIRKQVVRAESEVKQKAKKERDAAAKEEAARIKQMTKEEFDARNTTKNSPTKSGPTKIARVDAEGIQKGVLNGSTRNTTGGAGGTALTAAEGALIDRYDAMLRLKLKEKLDQTPGVPDGLRAEAEFRVLSDGRLVRGRIVVSSGDEAFDKAVVQAIYAVQMPPRPKGYPEEVTIGFSTRDRQR